jgi:hypothetical protein
MKAFRALEAVLLACKPPENGLESTMPQKKKKRRKNDAGKRLYLRPESRKTRMYAQDRKQGLFAFRDIQMQSVVIQVEWFTSP